MLKTLTVTAVLALLPISELRGALPYALAKEVPLWLAYPYCVILNALVGPYVYVFLSSAHKLFAHMDWYRRLFDKLVARARAKVHGKVKRFGYFGLVLFAGMLSGAVALVRYRRTEGLFWLLWMAPLYVALSLQENWDVPNKMGVIFILFHPLVLWCAAGLRAAVRSPRHWGVALASLVLVSWAVCRLLPGLDVAADERYYRAWPGQPRESSDFVQQEQERMTAVYLWPDFTRATEAVPFFRAGKLTGLLDDMADPSLHRPAAPYGWFPGDTVDQTLPPVNVEVDLSRRLFDREGPWVVVSDGDGEVDLDLTRPGGEAVIPNIKVPWSKRPITLFVTAGRAEVTGLAVAYEPWTDDPDRRRYLVERYARAMTVLLGWSRQAVAKVRTITVATDRIRLRVPQGPMSVIETISNSGNKYLYWGTFVGPGAQLEMRGPYRVLHN